MPPGMESTGPWRILCSRIYFKLFFLSFQEVSRMNLFIWESLEVPPLYKWQGNIIIHQHEMGFLTFSKEYFTFEDMKVARSEMQVHTLDMTQRKIKSGTRCENPIFSCYSFQKCFSFTQKRSAKRKYTILRGGDDPSGGFTMKLYHFSIRDL